jgi:cobalt/nickel transport protein
MLHPPHQAAMMQESQFRLALIRAAVSAGARMKPTIFSLAALLTAFSAQPTWAHFQELLPSSQILQGETQRGVTIDAIFTHPMAGSPTMNMGQPTQFGVIGREGKKEDLRPSLRSAPVNGKQAFAADYRVSGPANYIFFIEPAPYWEPEESKMLIHYTKVVVNAYGEDDGWDQMVGFPIEIRPLTRPFALWTGNAFSGIVYYNGKPSPFTRIEIEYKSDGKVKLPSDPYETAVIKSDANGYFSYAMPKAGWWGFAALVTGVRKMPNPAGQTVPVEEGGLIWVRTIDMR